MRPRRAAIAPVLLALLVTPPVPAAGDELAARGRINDRVATLLGARNWGELEKLAGSYRASKARTSSGIWRLSQFYVGIDAYFDNRRKDEAYWRARAALVEDWVDSLPASPTARLAWAILQIERGWSIRGTGLAHTVDPRNWEPFHAQLRKAAAYLETHKEVASRDPHWYELLAGIATPLGWPEARFLALLSEGLGREPQLYELYFRAIDYYAPKWGGNPMSIERFARDAVARTRDLEGLGMYARIYWYAAQVQYRNRLFADSLVHWPTMRRGIDDVLARYPDAWNINNFARFACLARDRAKTAELIARIDLPVPSA